MRWSPGEAIAWRVRVRIAPSDLNGELAIVFPAAVVHDEAKEVAVYYGPGSIAKQRSTEKGGPRNRVILGVGNGFSDYPWYTYRRLTLRRPEDAHSVSMFWDDATDELRFWYIDLVGPLRRVSSGFEFVDHGIDVVVEPDLSAWKWKDAEELEWYVEHGRYARAEADQIRAEGERAVARLSRDRERYERWRSWRPDPAWVTPPTLPAGWDTA
jgi:hypothetical protein